MFLVIWGNVLTRSVGLIPRWNYVRDADDVTLSPLNFENHDACVITVQSLRLTVGRFGRENENWVTFIIKQEKLRQHLNNEK